MPVNFNIPRGLSLYNCIITLSLEDFFSTKEDLTLHRCVITSWPGDIQVGRDLNFFNCNIQQWPENPYIGGNLMFRNCEITSLPNWITTLGPQANGRTRIIFLENTNLSEDIIERLRNIDAPGMQFYFSNQAAIPTQTFNSVAEGLRFWEEKADIEEPCTFESEATSEGEVRTFLSRLTETAEYKNVNTRVVLAQRIIDIFKLMAENPEKKEIGLVIISNGVTTCDDRIISALDQLEIMKQVHDVEKLGVSNKAENRLYELGKGFFYLKKIQDAATAHAATLTWVDEIEVQLAFQIGLKERFNLPLSTSNMIFRGCAQATDAQIEAAGDRIQEESTQADEQAFLENWEHWLKYKRREKAVDTPYGSLETTSYKGKLECAINYTPPEQPVIYDGRVYEYESLIKIYIERGTDPFTRKPIVFAELRRVE